MEEQNNTISCMEVYGAEGMFGDQYTQHVNLQHTNSEESVNNGDES